MILQQHTQKYLIKLILKQQKVHKKSTYNENEKTTVSSFEFNKRLSAKIGDLFDDSFVYSPDTPIVSIIIPGRLSLQIIDTAFETQMQILQSFDLTHCQVGYDGTDIICT